MSERIRGSYDDALQIDVYFTILTSIGQCFTVRNPSSLGTIGLLIPRDETSEDLPMVVARIPG